MVAGKVANLAQGQNQHTVGRANLPDLIDATLADVPVSVARAATQPDRGPPAASLAPRLHAAP